MKPVTIVLIDNENDILRRMERRAKAPGVLVYAYYVDEENSAERLILAIRELSPDIIVISDDVTRKIEGHVFIESLGGKFAEKVPGGNPRIISTSRSPEGLKGIALFHFPDKERLISIDRVERAAAEKEFVELLKESYRIICP